MHIRLHTKEGEAWWTDISLKHTPDFFVEQVTVIAFSRKKDTKSLLKNLGTLRQWIVASCDPGSALQQLGCDFGSEYAKQGHGGNVLASGVPESSSWLAHGSSRPF